MAYKPPLLEDEPPPAGTLPPTEPPEAPLPVPLGFGVPALVLPMEFGLVVVVGVGDEDGPMVDISPEESPPIGETVGVDPPA